MAYGNDLRVRVLDYMKEYPKAKKKEISALFKVSVDTIRSWSRRYKETGSFHRIIRTDYSNQHKLNFEDIKVYFRKNEEATLKTASEHFKVSDVTILNYFKRNGYSYKKKADVL